jgi:hypothetical protein
MKTNAWIPLLVMVGVDFAVPSECRAALIVSAFNTPTVVNFDSTVSGVNDGAFTGAGFQSSTTAGQLNSDSWAVSGWSDGNLAFGGTQTTAGTDYTRGTTTGPVTTGGIYGYDVDSSPAVNRGLGIQPGGSDWAPGTVTLKVQNNTGQTVTSFDLSYVVYIRNDQDRGNSFNFSYSTDDSAYTSVAGLNLTSAAASDANGLVINNESTTLSGFSVADGGFFYLRWSGADIGGSGSRDEFVLDDISIKAIPVPESPRTTLYFVLGLLAISGGRVWLDSRRARSTFPLSASIGERERG